MENSWSWEQKTMLIRELMQGVELAKQLREHLNNATSSVETQNFLAQRIQSSYEKAIMILNWSVSAMNQQLLPPPPPLPQQQQALVESPTSMNGSPKSNDFDGGIKENPTYNDASKKRKPVPRWTDQVRANSENALEGPNEDGYNWRKYGQKDILGAKYPRSYYRCTYRNTQNCWAVKQVQRSDEDPTIFDITYRGTHTCSPGNQLNPPPHSPEKPEQSQNNVTNLQNQTGNALHKSLRVDTEGLNNNDMAPPPPFTFPSTYSYVRGVSAPFVSPVTPEQSSYSPFQVNELAEVISAHTSATNSPTVDLDFSLDAVDFDRNFPIYNMGFFS